MCIRDSLNGVIDALEEGRFEHAYSWLDEILESLGRILMNLEEQSDAWEDDENC